MNAKDIFEPGKSTLRLQKLYASKATVQPTLLGCCLHILVLHLIFFVRLLLTNG